MTTKFVCIEIKIIKKTHDLTTSLHLVYILAVITLTVTGLRGGVWPTVYLGVPRPYTTEDIWLLVIRRETRASRWGQITKG